MTSEILYDGREQSFVKHLILQRYLQRFAYIIGSWSKSITYIDCFSGPWESRSQEHTDTSFAIAVKELRKAREDLKARQINVGIRCCFIEEDKAAFEKLRIFAEKIDDIQIKTLQGKLEGSIAEIVKYVNVSEERTFPFIFIDPKGWTGFALDVIRPLLTLKPGEVLINFMTEHIRRFIEWPDESNQQGFSRLFGNESFREKLSGLAGQDREDACVVEYMKVVQDAGEFSFASCAVVLKPGKDCSNFHLIYLTRDAKGVEVFKDAEKKSMKDMESARANAQQKGRVEKSGQRELFPAPETHDSTYFDDLRRRYQKVAREQLERLLRDKARVSYDIAWAMTLRLPLVWESDLKEWINDWISQGHATLEGLLPGKKSPKQGENITIHWVGHGSN